MSLDARTLRLFVVEDQPLFRELLSAFLSSVPDFLVVGGAATASGARTTIEAARPDLLIMDIDLPDGNGVALAASLRRKDPGLSVLLLSNKCLLELVNTLPEDVRRGMSYLSKSSAVDLDLLTSAIRSTAKGYTIIDPRLTTRSSARIGTGVASLTPRQFEVLRLLAEAKSTEAIASKLGLAQNSVVNILTSIYAQMNIPDDANARVFAVRQFLFETSDDV
jgi:DNA-binding NarL/FixJ family response regulator